MVTGEWWHGPRSGTDRAPSASTGPISSEASTPTGGGGASGPPFSPGRCSAARQLVTEAEPDLPRAVRTNSWDWLEDAIGLYERFGLEPVRYNDVLSRSLADPIPAKTVVGSELVPWNEVDSEQVRQAHNEAFADHWGSTPIPRESWDHLNGEPNFRPDLSFVAHADGEVVGYTRNAVYPEDWDTVGRGKDGSSN